MDAGALLLQVSASKDVLLSDTKVLACRLIFHPLPPPPRGWGRGGGQGTKTSWGRSFSMPCPPLSWPPLQHKDNVPQNTPSLMARGGRIVHTCQYSIAEVYGEFRAFASALLCGCVRVSGCEWGVMFTLSRCKGCNNCLAPLVSFYLAHRCAPSMSTKASLLSQSHWSLPRKWIHCILHIDTLFAQHISK